MIPGLVVALSTFPGVIVHEAAHMFFCKRHGIAVLDVCFLRFGNPAGYVLHEEIKDFGAAFAVAAGPFFFNSVLCLLICFPAFVPVRVFEVVSPLSVFLLWLGLSIGMHAFPSSQDAKMLWESAGKARAEGSVLALLGYPVAGLMYGANIVSFVWADLLYALAIGLGLPALVFEVLLRG